MTDNKKYSTQEVAQLFDYHQGSIYNRLSRTGEFHGIAPIKHISGRLVWPSEAVDALLAQQEQGGGVI